MMRCLECKEPYEPEPQNTSGFCSWDCFDVKPRPNAAEAFHGFLADGVTATRVDAPDNDGEANERVVAYLRKHGRSTLKEISSGTGVPLDETPSVLARLIVEGPVGLVTDGCAADGSDLFEVA